MRAGSIRVAVSQFEVQNLKEEAVYWRSLRDLVCRASNEGAEFIVFPEYFTAPLLSTRPEMAPEDGILMLAREFTPKVNELIRQLSMESNIWIIAGSQPVETDSGVENVCYVHGPRGEVRCQSKLHITPCETEAWSIQGGGAVEIIDTPQCCIGVQICYDIEFPEASRVMADEGVDVIFVPYCTDDVHGHLRVNLCARARAIENQIYVVSAGLCGTLSGVPNIDYHYTESAIYTPCDLGFAEQGIVAMAEPNVAQLLIADLDLSLLAKSRAEGTVTPRKNRRTDLFDMKFANLEVIHG